MRVYYGIEKQGDDTLRVHWEKTMDELRWWISQKPKARYYTTAYKAAKTMSKSINWVDIFGDEANELKKAVTRDDIRTYYATQHPHTVEEQKLIYKIEDVEVGDIAYFEGYEKGAVVVKVEPSGSNSRLKIETPEELKPFNLFGDTAVWLQDSCFQHATRPTQNKLVDKRLPTVSKGHVRVFETQEGVRIIHDGFPRGWSIELLLSDELLLELLDPSQFPLKDITEEES